MMLTNCPNIREVNIMGEPTSVSLRPHHGYRSWSTDWYGPDKDAKGRLRRHYKRFGKEGAVKPAAARQLFRRWHEEEWRPKYGSGNASEVLTPPPAYTVKDLCDDYYRHAQTFYVKGGEHTSQVMVVKTSGRRFAAAYGAMDPKALRAADVVNFRDSLLKPNRKKRGEPLTVETANVYLASVKRMIRWGMERDRIDADRAAGLVMVRPLQKGRCAAKDSPDIAPVPWDAVERTIAKLPANVAAMVLLQWHTGMRPGEVRILRPCDVRTGDAAWLYVPATHKMAHKGKTRRVRIGPEGQKVLAPYLARRRTDAYCFAPTESKGTQLRKAAMFGMIQYRDVVRRAAVQAGVAPWHPNRLRHSWATRVAEELGIEAAQQGLGHANLSATLIYAERSDKRAAEVALKVG